MEKVPEWKPEPGFRAWDSLNVKEREGRFREEGLLPKLESDAKPSDIV